MFSLICAWINGWVNNREADNLRRHCAHFDVTVMDGCRSLLAGCVSLYREQVSPIHSSQWIHDSVYPRLLQKRPNSAFHSLHFRNGSSPLRDIPRFIATENAYSHSTFTWTLRTTPLYRRWYILCRHPRLRSQAAHLPSWRRSPCFILMIIWTSFWRNTETWWSRRVGAIEYVMEFCGFSL